MDNRIHIRYFIGRDDPTAASPTLYADIYPSGVHVYETGDSIIEGAGYRHEGRNEGDENVVLWVTYIIPEGKPLAETDLSHCDA